MLNILMSIKVQKLQEQLVLELAVYSVQQEITLHLQLIQLAEQLVKMVLKQLQELLLVLIVQLKLLPQHQPMDHS
jgi:hypothetical protein